MNQSAAQSTQAAIAFNKAIAENRLSADPTAVNYAGKYMYMGTNNGKDAFKHIQTREYIK